MVVGMMSESQKLFVGVNQIVEPGVAQFAGGHLNGDLLCFNVFQGIELTDEELNPYPFSIFTNKVFVAVRFFATQMEIAVCKGYVVAAPPK